MQNNLRRASLRAAIAIRMIRVCPVIADMA